jgi:hypothetical protein
MTDVSECGEGQAGVTEVDAVFQAVPALRYRSCRPMGLLQPRVDRTGVSVCSRCPQFQVVTDRPKETRDLPWREAN